MKAARQDDNVSASDEVGYMCGRVVALERGTMEFQLVAQLTVERCASESLVESVEKSL